MDTPTLKVFNVLLEDPRCEEAFKIVIGQRSACGLPRPPFFEPNWRYSLTTDHKPTYSRYSLYIKYGRNKGDGSVRVGYFSIGTPPPGVTGTPWKQVPTLPRTDHSQEKMVDTLIINSPDDKRAPKRKVSVLIDSTGMPYPVDTNGKHCQSELNLGKKAKPTL